MDLMMEPLSRQPVSATDQVFDALYDAVISVKLAPGSKVSEAEVAKQLGVSRQPVRDAFFRLSKLGFLAIRPQRATIVTQISPDAVNDAVFTRKALEVECLRTAMVQARPEIIDALERNLAMQIELSSSKRGDFHALDEAFHETICVVAGHAHIWSLIKEQKAHMDRIRYLTLSDARRGVVIQEHTVILDAIRAGDIVLAETRLRTHIDAVLHEAEQIREKYPEYFVEPGAV